MHLVLTGLWKNGSIKGVYEVNIYMHLLIYLLFFWFLITFTIIQMVIKVYDCMYLWYDATWAIIRENLHVFSCVASVNMRCFTMGYIIARGCLISHYLERWVTPFPTPSNFPISCVFFHQHCDVNKNCNGLFSFCNN